MKYDKVIFGAGMYGLYAASKLSIKNSVCVIDCDTAPFLRGSLINQARLHNGYHYPRSVSTAIKSSQYYQRFITDYRDCINHDFDQIYAIAQEYSWTNAPQFTKFCNNLSLRCEIIDKEKYFNSNSIEAAYLTEECSFDASMLKDKLYSICKKNGVTFIFQKEIKKIEKGEQLYRILFSGNEEISTQFILNATYAGVNQIHRLAGIEPFQIKYELCEVVLCNVSDNIRNVGLTVMDGPFFSIMPFGRTGYHSITTVSRTPHITSYDELPCFCCQRRNHLCTNQNIGNCNSCESRPKSSFGEMYQIAKKYLNIDVKIVPVKSMFTLKPILKSSEIDDSRPTIIKCYSSNPYFYTVFSGKINTMYDLDAIIDNE